MAKRVLVSGWALFLMFALSCTIDEGNSEEECVNGYVVALAANAIVNDSNSARIAPLLVLGLSTCQDSIE